jgi:hypothetical protein
MKVVVKKCIVIPFETIFVAFSCIVLIKFEMQSPGSKNELMNKMGKKLKKNHLK